MSWKYALGLSLDDPGFDHTVLSEFRSRVAGHDLEELVLDRLLERLAAEGLVKAGGRQRAIHPCGGGRGRAEPAGAGRGKRRRHWRH